MTAAPPRFQARYETAAALQRDFDANLRKGRLFLRDARGAEARARCAIVFVCPNSADELEVPAEAVWVSEDGSTPGIGFELSSEHLGALETFVAASQAAEARAGARAERDPASDQTSDDGGGDHTEDGDDGANADERARNLYDRIRRLNTGEQQRLARTGTLAERVAVERCFAGAVWEALLSNPRLTPMEVAGLARQPSLPQPLFNHIVKSTAWIAAPEVQRALLNNPRLVGPQLDRVLRALPVSERMRIVQTGGYRQAVRTAARRMTEHAV